MMKSSKPPSKSACLRVLRAVLGERTRFARFGTDGLAVVAYTEGGAEYHAAECEPKTADAPRDNVPWIATVAAIRSAGYNLEVFPGRLELVPLAAQP